MRRVPFLVLMAFAVAACATLRPRVPFDAFPERFDAIQLVRVDGTENGSPINRDFLVAVKRDRESVQMVFMDPLWQKALLKVAYGDGKYTVSPLVEGVVLPFSGEEIVDTARAVFLWRGTLDGTGKAEFQTIHFSVQIRDIGGDADCALPRVIELQPRALEAPRLTITTKEWTCRPHWQQ